MSNRQDSTGFMCISAIPGHGPGPQDGPAPVSESTGSQKYHYDSSHYSIISMISYCSNFLQNPGFHSYNFPRQTVSSPLGLWLTSPGRRFMFIYRRLRYVPQTRGGGSDCVHFSRSLNQQHLFQLHFECLKVSDM